MSDQLKLDRSASLGSRETLRERLLDRWSNQMAHSGVFISVRREDAEAILAALSGGSEYGMLVLGPRRRWDVNCRKCHQPALLGESCTHCGAYNGKEGDS